MNESRIAEYLVQNSMLPTSTSPDYNVFLNTVEISTDEYNLFIERMLEKQILILNNELNSYTTAEDIWCGKFTYDVKGNGNGYVYKPGCPGILFIHKNYIGNYLDHNYVFALAYRRKANGKTQLVGNILYHFIDNDREHLAVYLGNSKTKIVSGGNEVYIKGRHNLKVNQYLYLKIESEDNNIMMSVISEVIEDDRDIKMLEIIKTNGVRIGYPNYVKDELKLINQSISKSEKERRVDLRNKRIFTIDGEDTKDFDDAVSIRKLDNGIFELGVHIADVAHYVSDGSKLDQEALKRGLSHYLPGLTIPMLPPILSDNLCSLKPNEDRLTITCLMDIDITGQVIDYKIFESVINSKARMTYSELNDLIAGCNTGVSTYNGLQGDIALMAELSTILNQRYNNRGRFVVYTPELRIDVDQNGKPLKVYEKEINKATELIENFMIVCNETIADYMVKNCLPCIFRIHEPIKEERLNEFIQLLSYRINNFRPNILSNPKEIFNFLNDSRVSKDDRLIREIFIRMLEKAIYSPQNIGHFGMASKAYVHFTSPIRRYSDLYIHRIIKCFIHGNLDKINLMEKQLNIICNICNENERIEVKTKSEVFKYKISEFMIDKIGSEYVGVIAAVTDKGIYVDILDYIRGFIHVDYFYPDMMYYDKILHAYRNKEDESEIYTYGTKIKVKVEKIITKTNTVIFNVV